MNNNEQKYYTRSMAHAQKPILVADSDSKIKTDDQDEDEHTEGQTVNQQQNEIMIILQQLLTKQNLLLDENKQLKQHMTQQQITIDNHTQAIEAIREMKITYEKSSTNPAPSPTTTTLVDTTIPVIINTEHHIKQQTAKQLQSKRINQLLDSTPFSGSTSQEVSDWIDDFIYKCDQLQLDEAQRLSVAIDLLKGNAKLWYDTHKDTIDSWVSLKDKLTAYFKLVTGTDQFQLEQKLYNRRRQQHELAIDYCHNVLKLCSKVNKQMNDETRLKHLTKGLNAVAQLHMDLKKPSTTEEFLEALIKYDKWQEENKVQQRATMPVDHRRNIPSRTIQQEQPSSIPPQQYNYSSQPYQSHRATQDPRPMRHASNEKNYGGCWSCGDMDHYQYNCPKNY